MSKSIYFKNAPNLNKAFYIFPDIIETRNPGKDGHCSHKAKGASEKTAEAQKQKETGKTCICEKRTDDISVLTENCEEKNNM